MSEHPPGTLRRCALALSIALLLISWPSRANAHPLHTAITELTEDRGRGIVQATIRVFADDFAKAVSRSPRGRGVSLGPAWDAAALAYIASAFALTDRTGRSLALRSCGIRRTADLLWICVEASSADGLAALKVRNRVLCDVWDDQVNVVQGTVAGVRRSLLFTKGDGSKPL